MPRPGLPPTPASSTEIRGKEQVETIDEFALPPAALHAIEKSPHSTSPPDGDGQTSPTGLKRKRRVPPMSVDPQSAAQASVGEATFSLPPPPSRSRKIIQVQPEDAKGSSSKSTGGNARKRSEAGKGGGAGASKTTAASRKTARKTAHSIIERRRRSKMNDEFETLKELVPAARGQSMHKLAILQAGIDYVRYLEECVQGLKGAQSAYPGSKSTSHHTSTDMRPHTSGSQALDDMEEDEDDDYEEDDDEGRMEDRPMATTPRASRPASAQYSQGDGSNTPSPAIHPMQSMHARKSSSSYAISTGSPSPAILPSFNPAYSTASSTLPSPALLPSDTKAIHSSYGSGYVTPITSNSEYHALQAHAKKALAYHGEADQEVIATLAMMGTERRRSQEEKDNTDGTRGMSVRDLLSG